MAHCVWKLISNGRDHTFWWKWEKKHVLPLGTKISRSPRLQPVIGPSFILGLWQFAKVKHDGRNRARTYCGSVCFFPVGFSWKELLWCKRCSYILKCWEYSNASLHVCVFWINWFDRLFSFFFFLTVQWKGIDCWRLSVFRSPVLSTTELSFIILHGEQS